MLSPSYHASAKRSIHIALDSSLAFGMTPPCHAERSEASTHCHAERSVSGVKHPQWIPRYARNDTVGFVMPQRSEASTSHWIPRYARNDTVGFVMPQRSAASFLCHASAKRSIHIALDSSLWLGMTRSVLSCGREHQRSEASTHCHAERSEASIRWIPRSGSE